MLWSYGRKCKLMKTETKFAHWVRLPISSEWTKRHWRTILIKFSSAMSLISTLTRTKIKTLECWEPLWKTRENKWQSWITPTIIGIWKVQIVMKTSKADESARIWLCTSPYIDKNCHTYNSCQITEVDCHLLFVPWNFSEEKEYKGAI